MKKNDRKGRKKTGEGRKRTVRGGKRRYKSLVSGELVKDREVLKE